MSSGACCVCLKIHLEMNRIYDNRWTIEVWNMVNENGKWQVCNNFRVIIQVKIMETIEWHWFN